MLSHDRRIGRTFKPASDGYWRDWHWHIRNAIRTTEALEQWIPLTEKERAAIKETERYYRWQITPYYASLMDPRDPRCPIRLQAIPSSAELASALTNAVDTVDELKYRKTNRVVHKYPDRVILNLTRVCPVYCRHCTRKYHTTHKDGTYFIEGEKVPLNQDIDYIRSNAQIRDVLITGGDPLSYPDERIGDVLAQLRSIEHVEIIRIGTRFPVLLPQRITDELCDLLERYHPLWISTHFNHPKEITPEAAAACERFLRRGIPVQNQSVLLKGINDDAKVMQKLVRELVKIRVRPYYLYHCDQVAGVAHFATDVAAGQRIMRALWGWTTGFSIPRYIVASPVGKVSLEEQQYRAEGDTFVLKGWTGNSCDLSDAEREHELIVSHDRPGASGNTPG